LCALILVLLCLTLPKTLISQTTAPETTGSITGVIVDSKDNRPIQGALIELAGSNISAVTDNNGRFEISNLDAGTYIIYASYIGYNSNKAEGIHVFADKKSKLSINLAAIRWEFIEYYVSN
jgi:hypothetical protein